MLNTAGKWRRSCAPSRVPSLWGTPSYEAAHTHTQDSVCLVSDTERKPAVDMGRGRKRSKVTRDWGTSEGMDGGGLGGGVVAKRSKWTDPEKQKADWEDVRGSLLIREASNRLRGLQHTMRQDFIHHHSNLHLIEEQIPASAAFIYWRHSQQNVFYIVLDLWIDLWTPNCFMLYILNFIFRQQVKNLRTSKGSRNNHYVALVQFYFM